MTLQHTYGHAFETGPVHLVVDNSRPVDCLLDNATRAFRVSESDTGSSRTTGRVHGGDVHLTERDVTGQKPDGQDGLNAHFCACLQKIADDGDRDAFKTLFDHFAPRVKTYVIKLGATPMQADELAQETMLRVWRKAGQFDATKAAASTWIFRIARNLRIDAFRRDSRPELDPDDPSLGPEPEVMPDDQLDAAQSAALVRGAMKDLPEEQKSVLQLAFFEDLSHGEIASRLQIPLGTVKSRSRLALARLRTYFDKQEPNHSGSTL